MTRAIRGITDEDNGCPAFSDLKSYFSRERKTVTLKGVNPVLKIIVCSVSRKNVIRLQYQRFSRLFFHYHAIRSLEGDCPRKTVTPLLE